MLRPFRQNGSPKSPKNPKKLKKLLINPLKPKKMRFSKLYVFDAEKVSGLPFSVPKTTKYRVLDWFDVRSGSTHDLEEIIDPESLFVNMIKKGRLGGQYSNGDQKEGFFRSEGRQPVAVYDAEIDSYRALPGGSLSNIDAALGPLGETSWKSIRENDLGDESVSGHFKNLLQSTGTGARLALDFAKESRRIGKHLVAEGIACSEEDVNTVVVNGFHHLYGPMDDGTVGNL